MRSLLGACLLSAAGSLPIHILPVLVAVVVSEGRVSVTQAGWLSSAYMTGQLIMAIGLPVLRAGPLKRAHALFASAILLICLLWSGYGTAAGLITGWFFIGAVSGALFYLGTLSAARFGDVALAFSLRLSASLLVSGLALIVAQLFTGSANYLQLVHGLSLGLAVIVAAGLMLYRPSAAVLLGDVSPPTVPASGWIALSILYVLFAGQIGYWAFALQTSESLPVPREHVFAAIAGCKIFAALILWPLHYRERRYSIAGGFLVPGIVLAAGIVTAVNAGLFYLFILGLLLWEVGFNVLSARLQAKAVQLNARYSGAWISAAIFLGAATGPVLQGHAIDGGLQGAFIAFALVSALLPAAWEKYIQRPVSQAALPR